MPCEPLLRGERTPRCGTGPALGGCADDGAMLMALLRLEPVQTLAHGHAVLPGKVASTRETKASAASSSPRSMLPCAVSATTGPGLNWPFGTPGQRSIA